MDKKSLETFLDKIYFPDEYRPFVIPVVELIDRDFKDEYRLLDSDRLNEEHYAHMAEITGTHYDLCMLALFILMGMDSKKRYDEMGIDEDIYYACMKEITIWSKRCYKDRGHVGTYGHEWHNNFFVPKVFRLGRLEFEEKLLLDINYTVDGVTYVKDTPCLNVHIPEDGKLSHDDVLDAYKRAYKFFGLKGNYPFVCHTWMLYPGNRDFMDPDSNVMKFMNDYEVLLKWDEVNYGGLWRVFGRHDSYDPDTLPADTKLQRDLIAYLKSNGNVYGAGYGIFIHNGEKILK